MSEHADSISQNSAPRCTTVWNDARLAHGFFGRTGGVSAGPYASLNLARWVGDQPQAVDENWRRVRRAIGCERFSAARLNQVHGKVVHAVGSSHAAAPMRGDGLVTATAGIMLCIMTADCVPVLLADSHAGVIGALHAGWRGVLAGIVNEGVAAMCRLGASPSRIRAAAGPAIGRCCFEVDNDLGDRFVREVAVAERHRTNGPPGKAMLDLSAIVRDQLVDAGVAPSAIALTPECTRCSSDRYFSRRAAGGASTGLQLSFIALRP